VQLVQEHEDKLHADMLWEEEEFGTTPEEEDLLLSVGSVGCMDCRLLHQGGGHRWAWAGTPRVMLNATFATATADVEKLKGFTYHASPHLPNVRLGDLLELDR